MPPSSGGRTEAGEPEDRGRLRLSRYLTRLVWPSSRARRVEIVLAGGALVAGFGLTIVGLSALHATHGRAETQPRSLPPEVVPAAEPSPTALDAQWAQYADHSTCADWAGADGVSAARISGSQLAWFFSDTDLGPVAPGTGFKTISGFLHNSVVVQTTQHGATRLSTLTGGGACTAPGGSSHNVASVIAPQMIGPREARRYWNADGITTGGSVLRFYNGFTGGQPPFVPVSTVIANFRIADLQKASAASPAGGGVARPSLTLVPGYTPVTGGTPIAWGSALLRAGNTVYIYGWASPDRTEALKQLYLARVPVRKLSDPTAWQYFAGEGQWAAGEASAQPVQPAGPDFNVSTGFSVLPLGGRYWLIQQDSTTGSPDIVAYPAPAPWGPFDPGGGVLLYRSPDVGLDAAHDFRIMYEARAEPALSAAGHLMISYNVNSVAVTTGCQSLSAFTDTITRPRFISVPMTAFTRGPGAHFRVQSGPSPYTDVTSKDPSQWFNGWAYPGGCPPVPALSDVSAQWEGSGTVALHWPGAGLGLAYRVYQRGAGGAGGADGAGGAGYRLVTTVSADGTRVSGLREGARYQFLVVPVNAKSKTGPGATATITAG